MTQPPDETPLFPIAGMGVPAVMIPRFVRAVRRTYPALTESIEDDHAAVRAVIRVWFVNLLITSEAREAEGDVEAAVETVRKERRTRGDQARAKALRDAQEIVELPTETPDGGVV